MNVLMFLLLIIGITSFTLIGSWYAKRYNRSDLLIGLYITFVLVSQILASKIANFDVGFTTFSGPAGVILFSLTYLITDIVNEKFGREETQRMIFIAFISQVAMIFFFWVGISLEPAPFWKIQDVWSDIFRAVPRITIASWVAFLITENFDAYVFHWFKKLTNGKYLWTRNVFSSIPALLLDSLIFIPLAFAGVLPLLPLIIGQTAVKWIIGLVNIPFMYLNAYILGKPNKKS